ncbi:MAG: isoprenylcysteine carboxylmethyltransferase family protein [bacterium]
MPYLKTFIFTIFVPGTVAGALPWLLITSDIKFLDAKLGAFRFIGAPIWAIGLLIYILCAWEFASTGRGTPAPNDPPKALVAKGLYRFSRNPMYVGILSLIAGEAVFFESPLTALYGVIIFLLFNAFIIFYEEPTLNRMFEESYKQFCKSTPRWIGKINSRKT